MRTKHFLSSAACVALSIFAASCSSEETTLALDNSELTSNSELTTFVGGMGSEEPVTRVSLDEYGNSLTRATMARSQRTDPALFSWEKGDCVYVRDDNWEWHKSTNTVNSVTTDKYKFRIEGKYLDQDQYFVLYKGNDNTTTVQYTFDTVDPTNYLTIKNVQTQSAFNNTEHFKESGDCATGTATKGANGYEFSLTHEVAYLCFLPYSTSEEVRNNYKIKNIKLTSTADVAGSYYLRNAQDGLLWNGDPDKTVTLNAGTSDGFPLTDCTAADINKSLYMVVVPGTGQLRVDVTLSKDGTESLISKTFNTVELKKNTVNNISLNLTFDSSTEKVLDYSNVKNINWVNNLDEIKLLPNANEMAWYISKGDAHWDDLTLWTGQDGKTYTGGVWLKKRDVIEKECNTDATAMKAAGPDGVNHETVDASEGLLIGGTHTYLQVEIKKHGRPANNELKNYFFLPSLASDNKTESLGAYYSSSLAANEFGNAFAILLSGDRNMLRLTVSRSEYYNVNRPGSPSLFK